DGRGGTDAGTGAAVLRNAVAELDPDLAVANVQTLQQIEAASVGARRAQLYLVGAFGAASLLIAALGIYSVLAYTVSARRHELALRMALGAGRGNVLAFVLRQGMLPVLVGIVVGIAAAMALGSVLASLLYEVAPTDAATLLTVVAVTLIAALLASLLPARRAAGTSLLNALRYE
ncbi:MAG TPA: FtsX-like permease family protein, partial [Gammaproteobacteria bacterium]|nr:FtsX-like permease family protein [Gammaproteobacteria bacterium]